MNPLTVRRYHATQVDRNKWIGTDKDLGVQVEAPTLAALIGLVVPDGLGVNVNVKIRPMGLSAPVQEVQEVKLAAAAHGYMDSRRLDKLDAWLHVNPKWPILAARIVNRSIEAHNGSLIDGPTAPTLRELIDKL